MVFPKWVYIYVHTGTTGILNVAFLRNATEKTMKTVWIGATATAAVEAFLFTRALVSSRSRPARMS